MKQVGSATRTDARTSHFAEELCALSQSCVPESGLPSQRNGSRPLTPTSHPAHWSSRYDRFQSCPASKSLDSSRSATSHQPAVESGSRIIKRYLAQGGNLDDVLRTSYCAIGMAVDEGSEWAFDVLRTSGASLRFSADRPDFLIFAAAASRNLSLAQRLIEEFGFDVNASDTCGSTPYIVALGAGDVAMATLFTRLGADTTASTEDGRQAVHFAAAGGLVEWLRTFLVQRERDELGIADASLMDVAVKNGQREIIALLQEYGMDAPLPDVEPQRISPQPPRIKYCDRLVRRHIAAGRVSFLDSVLAGACRKDTAIAAVARFSILRALCERCGAAKMDTVRKLFVFHLPEGPADQVKASYEAIIAMAERVGTVELAAM